MFDDLDPTTRYGNSFIVTPRPGDAVDGRPPPSRSGIATAVRRPDNLPMKD